MCSMSQFLKKYWTTLFLIKLSIFKDENLKEVHQLIDNDDDATADLKLKTLFEQVQQGENCGSFFMIRSAHSFKNRAISKV